MPFEFRETMAGSYHLFARPEDERPISFSLRARSRRLRQFLARPEVFIVGEVDAEGFADHRAMRGIMTLDVARTGKLPYEFDFVGNDDRGYRFRGEKTVTLRDLVGSMTTLPGEILDEAGAAVGTALLRFDMRKDLVKFLRSWNMLR